jgi:hypothetical protein
MAEMTADVRVEALLPAETPSTQLPAEAES